MRTLDDEAFVIAQTKTDNVVKSGLEWVTGEDEVEREVRMDELSVPWAKFRRLLREVEDRERSTFLTQARRELAVLEQETGVARSELESISDDTEIADMVLEIRRVSSAADLAVKFGIPEAYWPSLTGEFAARLAAARFEVAADFLANTLKVGHIAELSNVFLDSCFLGAITIFAIVLEHRIRSDADYGTAAYFWQNLDGIVGSMHPDIFDELTAVKPRDLLVLRNDTSVHKDGKGRLEQEDTAQNVRQQLANTTTFFVEPQLFDETQYDLESVFRKVEETRNTSTIRWENPVVRWWPVSARKLASLYRDLMTVSPSKPPPDFFGQNAFFATPEDEVIDGVSLKKAFKIFVYDVDDPVLAPELYQLARGPHFCRDLQWGFEVLLHMWFLACPCRTDNPEEADFFFVPNYAACHTQVGTFNYTLSTALFESLIPKLPYFARSNGRDHVFVWGGGEGADGPFRSWRLFVKEAIFVMSEPELWNFFEDWQVEPSYNFAKDILVPPLVRPPELHTQWSLAGFPVSAREYVADFVGWNRRLHKQQGKHEGPRGTMLRWVRDDTNGTYDDLHVLQDVSYGEGLKGQASSKFCLVPRGISGYTSRFVRSLWAGCVPVMLSDDYEVPFWQLVRSGEQRARHKPRSQARADWMVRWPMRKMEHPVHLVDWLRAVPAGTIDLLSANAENVRCWYLYPPSRADQTFNTEQLEDLCPSSESLSSSDDVVEPMQEGGWRQRNALRAVHALLYTKKWSVAKMGLRTFYGPDIRSQNPTKWFLLDKESAVSEEDA